MLEFLEARRLLSSATLSGSVLTITGDGGNDNMSIVFRGGKMEVRHGSGTRLLDVRETRSVRSIVVNGLNGNDNINISKAKVPVRINGSAGDDTIRGGSKNDTLIGGDGDDDLVGNGGNDSM